MDTQKAPRLGDPCFIVDIHLNDGLHPHIRILHATITFINNVNGLHMKATSTEPDRQIGPIHTTSSFVFFSEEEARAWIEARRVTLAQAFNDVKTSGVASPIPHPITQLPALSQVVYLIDKNAREIQEVRVTAHSYEWWKLEAGYDSCPGNPEADVVPITDWWPTKEAAERAVAAYSDGAFTVVSLQEMYARTDARIESIWASALRRMKQELQKEASEHPVA